MKKIIAINIAVALHSFTVLADHYHLYHSNCNLQLEICHSVAIIEEKLEAINKEKQVAIDKETLIEAIATAEKKGYNVTLYPDKSNYLKLFVSENDIKLSQNFKIPPENDTKKYELINSKINTNYSKYTYQDAVIRIIDKLPKCRILKKGNKISYIG